MNTTEKHYTERTCRCCLAEGDNMLSINTFMEIECSKTISQVLMECTGINADDNLPQIICSNCIQRVEQAFNFKEMCKQSYIYLRQYMCESIIIKTENEMGSNEIQLVQVPGFNAENDLIDENTDEEPYKAEGANQTSQPDEDYRLVNNAKKVNGRFQCELCEKSLADRRTFLLHIRLHLGKNLKHCEVCNRGFAKQNHLDRHQATHAKDNTSTNKGLNNEKLKHFVPKSARKCSSILKHDNTVKLNKESYEEKLKEIVSIDDELRLVNAAKELNGRLQCPICPKTLSQRKILKLHIRAHVGKNLLHCIICNRGFAKGSNLNRHMLLHRDMDTDEEEKILKKSLNNGLFCCPYCNKTFIDRQTFRLHIRLHISKLFVRCDICNQVFTF